MGKIADLSERVSGEEADCDASDAETWSDESFLIREEFLQTIMFHAPYRDVITRGGISIRCAKFGNSVNLANGTFPLDITFTNSYFAGSIRFDGAVIGRSLSFVDCHVEGKVVVDNATITESFYVGGSSRLHDKVSLESARIGDDIELADSGFVDVVIRSAVIGGNVSILGSVVRDFLMGAATVTGNVEVEGSRFRGRFVADRARITGHMFGTMAVDQASMSAPTFQYASAQGVEVDGNIDLSDVTIGGELDLTDGRSSGSLVFGREICVGSADNVCDLHLDNLSVDMLVFRSGHSWQGLEGRVRMSGLEYAGLRLIPSGYPGEDFLKKLVDVQHNPGGNFRPWPYRKLEETLRSNGYDAYAKAIVFDMFKHERKASDTGLERKASIWLGRITMGYGYEGWISIMWIIGLVILGTLVGAKSPLSCGTWAQRALYSIDKAIPLISVDKSHDNLRPRGLCRAYYCVHTTLGFVFISILVGTAVGVIR